MVKLLTDLQIAEVLTAIAPATEDYDLAKVMAAEINEYRRAYGTLGCTELDVEFPYKLDRQLK